MAHYATLSDFQFDQDVDDIRGAALYGENDEKLGTLDDVVLDHDNGRIRYAVIDSNGWLPGGKYLIPAHRIQPYHKSKNDFYADLDKVRIRMFPPYDKKAHESEGSWRDYEDRYQAAWTEDPIEHRAGSTHNVTPEPGELGFGKIDEDDIPTSEMEALPQRIADRDPAEATYNASQPFNPTTASGPSHGESDVTYEPGKQISRPIDLGENRWSRFQEDVRRHRDRIVGACGVCGGSGSRKVA